MQNHGDEQEFGSLYSTDKETNSTTTYIKDIQVQKSPEGDVSVQTSYVCEETSTHRLTTLHARLHEEADKIRKWKTHVDFEMKSKEKKINQSEKVVISLRESLLELQIENETLSTKFQDEMNARNDMIVKMNATRELCNSLKDYTTKVDDKIALCERERDDMSLLESENKNKYKDLTEKFSQMEISCRSGFENLTKELKAERIENGQLKEMYDEKIQSLESNLQHLQTELIGKDEHINELRERIQSVAKDIESEKNNYNDRLTELDQLKAQNFLYQTQLEQYGKEMEGMKMLLEEMKSANRDQSLQLDEALNNENKLTDIMQNKCRQYDSEIRQLEKLNDSRSNEIEEQRKRIYMIEEENHRRQVMLSELASEKDSLGAKHAEVARNRDRLTTEKKEVQDELDGLRERCITMKSTLSKNTSEIQGLQSNKSDLEQKLSILENNNASLIKDVDHYKGSVVRLEAELDTIQESSSHLNTLLEEAKTHEESLNDRIHILEDTLKAKDVINKQIELKAAEHIENISHLKKQLEDKDDTIKVVDLKIEEANLKELNLKESIEQHESEIAKLRLTSLQEHQAHEKETTALKNKLNERLTEIEAMHETVKNCDRHNEQLTEEIEKLNTTIKQKDEDKKQLDKELKSVQSKQTSKGRKLSTLEKSVDTLEKKLKEKEQLFVDLSARYDEEVAAAQTEKATTKESMQQVEKLTSELLKCEIAKLTAQKSFDAQMADMIALMEKFKNDNVKVLNEKEQAMKEMKDKMKQSMDDQIAKINGEVANYKTQITNMEKSHTKLVKDLESRHKKEITASSREKKLNEQLKRDNEKMLKTTEDLEKQLQSAEHKYTELNDSYQKLKEEHTLLITSKQTSNNGMVNSTETNIQDTFQIPATTLLRTPRRAPRTPQRGLRPLQPHQNILCTPKQNVRIPCYTPVNQKPLRPPPDVIMKTPQRPLGAMRLAMTPQGGSEMKTPQQSILRPTGSNSAMKRRKVVFHDDDGNDSSSSDLMELDDKSSKYGNTVILTKSPGIRKFTGVLSPIRSKLSPVKTKSNIVTSTPKKVPKPPSTPKPKGNDATNKKRSKKTSNIRTAPIKPQSKLFKYSPAERKQKQKSKVDRQWFDEDNVFGFGAED